MLGDVSGRRHAHIPLTYPVSLTAVGQIEMDVRFMVAVGARPKNCREPVTGTITYVITKLFRNGNVGQSECTPVSQYE